MKHTFKTTLLALTALAILPNATIAYEVRSPCPGTVTATTYYSDGSPHKAVDIAPGSCNYWGAETGVVGSIRWTVTIQTPTVVCNGNGSNNQNEAKASFASGWAFRQWHFIKTADSYTRTCDRCQIGNIGGTGHVTGPHAHLQRDRTGTLDTSWYTVSKGNSVNRSTTIGNIS
jgi:hypothetical protein